MRYDRLLKGPMWRHATATPLTNLLLNLELAQQTQPNSYLRRAYQSACRLKQLYELVSRPVTKISFPVKSTLLAAVNYARQLFPHSLIKFNYQCQDQLALIGQPFLLQEAIICALTNAVESYHPTSHQPLVRVNIRREFNQLKLAIIDGGRGLRWWQKPLIFREGWSFKKTGHGYGLSWIKRVIYDHFSGSIKLISRPAQGTTMEWTIPLNQT